MRRPTARDFAQSRNVCPGLPLAGESSAPSPTWPGLPMKEALEGVRMAKRPCIVLPPDRLHVPAAEIPSLIATALHPPCPDEPPRVTGLQRCMKDSESASTDTKSWDGWPLEGADLQVLNELWPDLSAMTFPMLETEWARYAARFEQAGKALDWRPEPVVVTPDFQATLARIYATEEHRKHLQRAVDGGELVLLDPLSRIRMNSYSDRGLIPIKAVEAYLTLLEIDLTLHPHESQEQGEHSTSLTRPGVNTVSELHPREGLSKRSILAVDWPIVSKSGRKPLNFGRALKDVQGWIRDAIVVPGRPGSKISATWNPALLGVCLVNARHARREHIDRFIRASFPDFIADWEQASSLLDGQDHCI